MIHSMSTAKNGDLSQKMTNAVDNEGLTPFNLICQSQHCKLDCCHQSLKSDLNHNLTENDDDNQDAKSNDELFADSNDFNLVSSATYKKHPIAHKLKVKKMHHKQK